MSFVHLEIPDSVSADFWVNVAATVFCFAVGSGARQSWIHLSRAGNHRSVRALTANRRNYSIIVVSLIVGSFLAAAAIFHQVMTTNGIVWLALICLLAVATHLIRELSVFWGIGFNYISKTVSTSTYKDAFDQTTTRFSMIGTNAYSFCDLPEFAAMVRRVRESGGQMRMLLAHPNSNALKEAALSRDQPENLYRDQAQYSLGRLETLKSTIGAPLAINLYLADRIVDLPIFRIMFINDTEAIAAVAVYGRADHGSSLPQMYARKMPSRDDSHRCMYSVLNRYFEAFWDQSVQMNGDERAIYCQAMGDEDARRASLLGS